MSKFKLKLVPYWRSAWRLISVQLGLLGATVTTWLVSSPDAMLQAWMILPDTFKQLMPPKYMPLIGVAIFLLGTFSRIIVQQRTTDKINEKLMNSGKDPLPVNRQSEPQI